MLNIHAARDRAVRRAIETGDMPNLDLIHTMQKAGGYTPCFGRAEGACHETVCRFHGECTSLAGYEVKPVMPTGGRKLRPFQRLPRTKIGTFRDGSQPSRADTASYDAGRPAGRPRPSDDLRRDHVGPMRDARAEELVACAEQTDSE